jgi:hypothetical protein
MVPHVLGTPLRVRLEYINLLLPSQLK